MMMMIIQAKAGRRRRSGRKNPEVGQVKQYDDDDDDHEEEEEDCRNIFSGGFNVVGVSQPTEREKADDCFFLYSYLVSLLLFYFPSLSQPS